MKLILLSLLLCVSIFGFSQETDTVSIYFGVDESIPNTKQAFEPFDKNSRIVRIEAHCDVSGSSAHNMELAKARLNYAKQQLTGQGYHIEHAEQIPYGETMSAKFGWSDFHSRRVDIIYIEPNIRGAGLSTSTPAQTRNQVHQGYTPSSIERDSIETVVTPVIVEDNESFSTDAVTTFLADENATELKLDMTILFFNASDKVLPESEPELKELQKVMKKNPELKAVIHGHVCCQPNQEISEARARAVCMYLIKNKISNERLSYEGHSNTQPKAWPEETEEDQKLNRRVSVVFKK